MRGGIKKFVNSNEKKPGYNSLKRLSKNHYKLIKSYLISHKRKLFFAVLATIFVSLSALISPYLMKVAIDDYIIPGNFRGLTIVSILILLSYVLSWFSSYWQTYLAGWVGQDLVSSLRKDVFSHIKKLDLNFYNQRRTGEIMSRVTHDVNTLSELITGGFVHFVSDIFTLLGIIVIMFYLDISLTLIICLLIPFVMFIFFALGQKMRNAYHHVREEMARLNADVEENLSGIRTIKALNREQITQENFKKLSINNMKANLRAVGIFSLFFPAMNFSRVLGEALVLGYGGLQVIDGNMTVGVLAAFLSYVRRFFRPIMDLSQVFNTYQAAAAALDRINEYFNIPAESSTHNISLTKNKAYNISSNTSSNSFNFKGLTGEIIFENVSFSYGRNLILDNFDLEVPPKTTSALVGASGAGKSTVINLLTRLYEPEKGKILLDGIDIKNIPPETLRSQIGVVSQNVQLFDRSIEENIKYGTFGATLEEVKEAAQKTRAHDFIKDLPEGYKSTVGKEGIKLSGGQKQLISLSRVILKDPKILILDEPTSNVDTYTERLIINTIEKMLKDKTIILISHRISTIKAADEITFISNGKVEAKGTHYELIKNNPKYKDIFRI
ncbi:ABC transporter ATP-binding protein [Natranaerofaba carboxydovora]|uniref:ABC transporter ATP-binding protein n=1 Tax=Natranaerofaba carboxydovora TaxID=2742683 RepID=UPI001F13E744|nr:ABC transporter ATP-binding protein [Natranaerofaba carboxydovora]UMZ74311.1 putative ABC transporter ATP-binding protein [Natranaerofaba carboxydovora]